jgi:hypothetical protein
MPINVVNSWKGLAIRGANIGTGIVYLGLSLYAANLALGFAAESADEDQAAKDWTAWLMSQPFGVWLVNAAGIGFGVAGVVFLWKTWRADFRKYIAGDEPKPWIVFLRRVAFRGVAFLLVGGFLVLAGIPQQS